MADRLSDEDLGDLERLAERAGRHVPLGLWSSEALLRLIAEVRELRAERAWVVKVEADARDDERAKIVQHLRYAANMLTLESRNKEAFVLRHEAAFVERGEHRR